VIRHSVQRLSFKGTSINSGRSRLNSKFVTSRRQGGTP